MNLLPGAPESRTTTDYVVMVFAFTVAMILFACAVAVLIGALLGYEVTGPAQALADVLAVLITAIVGFAAGRGSKR